MAFVVDTTRFQAEGAVLNWNVVARRLGILNTTAVAVVLPTVLQLRWTLKDELGLPTEPFTVWRRDKKLRAPKPIAADTISFGVFFGSRMLDLKGSYSTVELNVSSATGGQVYGFVGNPWLNNTVVVAAIAAGNNVVVSLSAPAIEGLTISNSVVVNTVRGVMTDDLSAASGWQKLEYVGLPVQKGNWMGQGIGLHGTEQGMFGGFVDAIAAAKQRLERGAPPIGWAPLVEPGLAAPPWAAPQPNALIADLNAVVLADLRLVAGLPPASQAAKKVSKFIPPPENSSGQKMSEPGTTSHVAPLSAAYMASSVDCFNCLALGFGTAYPVVASPEGLPTALDFDYMISARFERGPLGTGAPVEYAAIVPSPVAAIAPPIPASMQQEMMGNLRPLVRDGQWRASVRISWDRPIPVPLFRARSFAFARAGVTPASPFGLVMNKRSDGSPLPIAVNYFTSPQDPEPNRLSAVEREITIPNNPGSRTLKYAAAHQDIYGQWSTWSSVVASIDQPPVDRPRIVSAAYRFTKIAVPPATKCEAELVIEFLWDWRVRTPHTISFRGRLFPAAYHGAPPPDTSLPSGLQTKLGVPPAATFTLKFHILGPNGAPTSDWTDFDPDTHMVALNEAGDEFRTFGNAQGAESRRYRATIPGFELDFGPSGHIGLALWGQGQETIAPQNAGPWSADPSVISTSDPRPPHIEPDIVTLSSLPDAAGQSHAVLKWTGSPGSDGYFIYETSETKLRKAADLAEPDPALTLSQRLTALRNIFDQDPVKHRAVFTRRTSRVIKGTSCDVTLPRGSTAIHLFIVLGVSAGQVEAAWPGSSLMWYAFAAPRVPKPGAPTIEAASFEDTGVNPHVYRSRLLIRTRTGPRVKRIDLHRVRVDDAARELDTMGPPILTVEPVTPDWEVEQEIGAPGPAIVQATGTDTPGGSWKRVWYRAVAWSGDDQLRGTLGTRSPASSSAWVVVPPSTPPDLSALTMQWPGTAPPDVLLLWTSAAVVRKTPVGSHRIAIRAKRIGAPLEEPPILAFDGVLSELALSQPVSGSAAWRIDGTKPAQYRTIIRRADINDAVAISVRITDPLGRTSERLATINPGHILPDPNLSSFVLSPSVNPPGVQLDWTSSTPLDPPVYSLRVTVFQPPKLVGQLWIPQPPIVLDLPLASVPLDEPGPVPPGADPVRVRRLQGPGPSRQYYVFVRVPFTQIVVRLSAPDGRTAQHTQLPS